SSSRARERSRCIPRACARSTRACPAARSSTTAATSSSTTSGVPMLEPLRALLVLPFALFVPGYAAVSATFPARSLSASERTVASLAASLALLALTGVALDAAGARLTGGAYAAVLAIVSAAGAGVALGRGSLTLPRPRAHWLVGAAVLLVAVSGLLVADALT